MNDVMRNEHHELSALEKRQIKVIKDKGSEMYEILEGFGRSEELDLAKIKIEEAVMWAVKHVTQR